MRPEHNLMDLSTKNPFSTGGGDTPKKVVGQDKARKIINSVIAAIKGPTVLPQNIVFRASAKRIDSLFGPGTFPGTGVLQAKPLGIVKLLGPRVMGKTTLLEYAHKQAEQAGVHIVHLGHLEDMNQEASALSTLIDELKAPWWHLHAKIREFHVAGLGYGFGLGLEKRKDRYEKLLQNKISGKPVLFLLDDAQYYEPKILRMIIRSTQLLLSRGYRVAMILAGSPHLTGHLMDLEIPSINRGHNIYVDTIGDDEAREALIGPFEDHNFAISAEAAKSLLSLAGGYPYFIQTAGFMAWDTMVKEKAKEIDAELMEKIVALVEDEKEWFFYSMYEQLDRDDLLPVVNEIVDLLYGHGRMEAMWKSEMIQKLESKVDLSRAEIWKLIDKLLDLGILNIDASRNLSPGIPGFFHALSQINKRF